jgi:AraC-like DNA-binding protein
MPTIAVTSTLAMVYAAEVRGAATADVLERVGVTRGHLEDPDARLPAETVTQIWTELRQRTGDPTLQLAAPATLPWGRYRVIDYLIAASTTIGAGIDRFARYFALIADAVTLSITHDDEGYSLTIQRADGGPVPPVYVDYVFAALVTRIRLHICSDLHVHRVELRQAQPARFDAYGETFRSPIVFGARADRIFFTDVAWQSRPSNADGALAQLMEEHARMLAQQRRSAPDDEFRRSVQAAITAALPAAASVDDVARTLHLSVRTLQRRLGESGTTFRDVSESVRAQLAAQYLADAKVGIAEVAFLLGFSDQTSFNRAFRRWTGDTPGQWRKRGMISLSPLLQNDGSAG